MIKVKYNDYFNDYNNHIVEKNFNDLDEFKEWIKVSMELPYEILGNSTSVQISRNSTTMRLVVDYGHIYMFRLIKDDQNRILFTDGTFTNRQTHMSKAVEEFCDRLNAELSNPQYKFVD